jgi:putative ABC transport system permease protein
MLDDLKHAFRALRMKPGFSAVVIFTLALGIGANTAIFSVVDTVLLRPPSYPNAPSVMAVWEKRPTEGTNENSVSPADFLDWRSQSKSFEHMAAFEGQRCNLTGGGDPEVLEGERVSPGFFEVLGIRPALGRTFSPSEEQPGEDTEAMVSHGLWQQRFGSDPALVGKTIEVDSKPRAVVGVLPPDYHFPFDKDRDLYVPIAFTPALRALRGIHQFAVIANRKPNVTSAQAQAEMDLIASRLERQYPDVNKGHGVNLVPLHDQMAGEIRPALLVLLGAVGLVLLIACANVANLLLARAASVRKEAAIRAALGSTRLRLIRESITESVMLAVLGGSLGTLLASWTVDLLRAAYFSKLPFFTAAGLERVAIDLRVLLFTFVMAMITACLFGIVPAIFGSKTDLNIALKEGSRGSTRGDRHGFRSGLVIAEITLSLILLTGAGLLFKSFGNLLTVPPGFQPEHLVTAGISLPESKYRNAQQATAFFENLLDHTRRISGVRSAAVTDILPFTGDDSRLGVVIANHEKAPFTRLYPRLVSASYFETMGIPLKKGRGLQSGDITGRPLVAVLTEAAARKYFPNENAVGQHFAFNDDKLVWIEIVGVAGNVKGRSLEREATPDVFLSYLQTPYSFPPTTMHLVVRTDQPLARIAPLLRGAVSSIDKNQPISRVQAMNDMIAVTTAPRKFNLLLLGTFAVIALLLAAAGLYGVMAYLVTERTGEIGIRVALGAMQSDVLKLVVARGMVIAGIGLALGTAGAFVCSRLLANLLYGVTIHDASVFAIAPVVLALVAFGATYIPARRAMRIDPMIALRVE